MTSQYCFRLCDDPRIGTKLAPTLQNSESCEKSRLNPEMKIGKHTSRQERTSRSTCTSWGLQIHRLNHFKVYDGFLKHKAFSLFTVLCDHHYYLVPEHFHQKKAEPSSDDSPSSLPQPPLTADPFLFLWICRLDISCQWVTQHAVLGVWLFSLSMFSKGIRVVSVSHSFYG